MGAGSAGFALTQGGKGIGAGIEPVSLKGVSEMRDENEVKARKSLMRAIYIILGVIFGYWLLWALLVGRGWR
jgi:hypothetical protein